MRRSQTGTPSSYGGSRAGTKRVVAPWGKPIAKRSVGRTGANGQSRRNTTSSPRGSSVRKATPDASLWSMRYKANDPLAWPLENPTQRSDLEFDKTTTAKANFNNTVVNKAFQRGGYAG